MDVGFFVVIVITPPDRVVGAAVTEKVVGAFVVMTLDDENDDDDDGDKEGDCDDGETVVFIVKTVNPVNGSKSGDEPEIGLIVTFFSLTRYFDPTRLSLVLSLDPNDRLNRRPVRLPSSPPAATFEINFSLGAGMAII